MMRELKRNTLGLLLLCLLQLAAHSQSAWQKRSAPLETRWAKEVTPANALPEYPRPQMARKRWQNLNGLWQYAITSKDGVQPTTFAGQILVPYPIESALSGVQKPLLPEQRLWYRRTIQPPNIKKDERVLLHFGAVDWQATVYVNGKEVGQHQGGYQNFSFDITDALKAGDNELVVSVWDPTDKGPNPRGKQVLEPKGIMYTASSGIWQTVWLETVPSVSISSLELTPDVDSGALRARVNTSHGAEGYTVAIAAKNGKKSVGSIKGNPNEELKLAIPSARLWSPAEPFLYDLSVQLLKNGKVVDTVGSYFGMRKIEVKKDAAGVDRIFLNNKYTYNLGVLDQGFWPEGLHTAPTDEALRFDVEAIKEMGFNTIRKHIKIEPARWYYWCDRLGMLVWQDMPQPGKRSPEGKSAFEVESAANMKQLHNHPSIVTWVLFNESWGLYDQERLTKWMKQLDPSRLLNGHSGAYINEPSAGMDFTKAWVGSDMVDIHAYPDPKVPPLQHGKAQVVGEFGGVGVLVSGHQWDDLNGWGYIQTSPPGLATKYEAMTAQLKKMEGDGLSASIYTEPFDVETESNGLLTYDRKVLKMPLDRLRRINSILIPDAERLTTAVSALAALPVADPDPEHEYKELLALYNQGKKDPLFLRQLALLANSLKHFDTAEKIANEYISGIARADQYTKGNIQFYQALTRSSKDKGFNLFYRDSDKIDQVMGSDYSQGVVDYIIAKEEIDALLFPHGKSREPDDPWKPDWDEISATITRKYNAAYADRTVSGAKVRWYGSRKEWPEYSKSLVYWVEKYRVTSFGFGGPVFYWNKNAWDVFEHSNDKAHLNIAISWALRALQIEPTDHAVIDTYANLLYKTGKSIEGINWQEKAVQIAKEKKDPDLKSFEETLSKMKKGETTWPVLPMNEQKSP